MITAEEIQKNIPQYLTSQQQAELVNQLNDFENRNYYSTLFPDDILQGDGWSSIEVVKFEDGIRDKIKGILLSNSCDLDPANRRDFPSRIVFAPLVRLDAYVAALRRGLDDEQINNKLAAIRKQHVTSLFFLSQGGTLEGDHIAVLDD
jgi:hypothetical protein